MIASADQIEAAIRKMPSQNRAQKMIDKLMRLKELSEDYGSPLIVHLRAELERLATEHGMKVLSASNNNVEEDRKYFQVFCKAWEVIDRVCADYYKANEEIIKLSRR